MEEEKIEKQQGEMLKEEDSHQMWVGRNLLVVHAHGTKGENRGFRGLFKSTNSI